MFEFTVLSAPVRIHQRAAAVLLAVEELARVDLAVNVSQGAPTVPERGK
jgi:hypothetical protein